LIGGSSILTIGIRVVGTKAMAVLLGPAGFGLMSLYSSIADVAQNIAGMGVNSSGVRQIAAAVGSGDREEIARTAYVLRRTSVILGLFGAILLIGLSPAVSILSFGSDQQTIAIVLLSAAVLLSCVGGGQGALIQGMRRISDLAKMRVLGALFGTMISIALVYFLRENGLVLSLVGSAALTVVISWWYTQKIKVQCATMTISQLRASATPLLKLGFTFMATGLMMSGAAYAVRVLVVRYIGFEAAGLYQSAWALGGVYVGFILESMGADFYPRLTAVAEDNTACNRIVNEQTQVGLLMAAAGVLATLTFSPLVISLFYTPKFVEAVEVLRWLCLGMTLRMISWPMGFIIVAKGAQRLFFWSELAWTAVYIGLSLACIAYFGLKGTGIAFFISYIFHVIMIYVIVRHLSGFDWSAGNKRLILFFILFTSVVFCGFYLLPPVLATIIGTSAVLVSGVYSFCTLVNLVDQNRLPRSMQQLRLRLRSRIVGQ
jgi:PST family polysaccharide transporter